MHSLPSLDGLSYILQQCRKGGRQTDAFSVYFSLCQSGLESTTSLANELVSVFTELGDLSNGQRIFTKLIHIDKSSCNSLIRGLAGHGRSQEAILLYHKVKKQDPLFITSQAYVALIKACGIIKDLKLGLHLHDRVSSAGFHEKDIYIGSSLIDMYAKCDNLEKAKETLDNIPIVSVVTWNALITGYVNRGHVHEALKCLNQMRGGIAVPDSVTFTCCLKACSVLMDSEKGQQMHLEISKRGLGSDSVVGSGLMNMYCKCGLHEEAHKVFYELQIRDAVSWNALIAGYAGHGHDEKALECFEEMENSGLPADSCSYVCSLKACAGIMSRDKGQEIHMQITKKGLEIDLFVWNSLLDMYAKCGTLGETKALFDSLPGRDVITWNILIAAYVQYGIGDEALKLFNIIPCEIICSDDGTYIGILKACIITGNVEKGQEIHNEICKKGLESSIYIANTLIDMYSKCYYLLEAHNIVKWLSEQNSISWTALISGYVEHEHPYEAIDCLEEMQSQGISPVAATFVCSLKACAMIRATQWGQNVHSTILKMALDGDLFVSNTLVDMYAKCGFVADAQEVFSNIMSPDQVSWNALLGGYVENNFDEESLNAFEQMQLSGIYPDAYTFVCILKACSNTGLMEKGHTVNHEIIIRAVDIDPFVGNTLVDMYAKGGLLGEAQEVFDSLPYHGLVSWNALMTVYAQHGQCKNVIFLFNKMIDDGSKPNWTSFVNLISACSHQGLVEEGQVYYQLMEMDWGIIPTHEHYTCAADLFRRAGQVDRALRIVEEMPFFPCNIIWQIVLGASCKMGDLLLGKLAFEHATQLEETETGAYVCLSNMYAMPSSR